MRCLLRQRPYTLNVGLHLFMFVDIEGVKTADNDITEVVVVVDRIIRPLYRFSLSHFDMYIRIVSPIHNLSD